MKTRDMSPPSHLRFLYLQGDYLLYLLRISTLPSFLYLKTLTPQLGQCVFVFGFLMFLGCYDV